MNGKGISEELRHGLKIFFTPLPKPKSRRFYLLHIEYYIYDNDCIGNQIAEILIAKAKSDVKIRFIYDDFGSENIRTNIVQQLRANGVEAHAFNKINFVQLANRLNYRNNRKIIYSFK